MKSGDNSRIHDYEILGHNNFKLVKHRNRFKIIMSKFLVVMGKSIGFGFRTLLQIFIRN